jgi:hypothetical protein
MEYQKHQSLIVEEDLGVSNIRSRKSKKSEVEAPEERRASRNCGKSDSEPMDRFHNVIGLLRPVSSDLS